MSEPRKSFITTRMAVGLVAVSMLSLVAYFALSAYAPDLRSDSSGGGDALSKSAIGFGGARFLLEKANVPVTLGKTQPPPGTFSLVILTPEAFTGSDDVTALTQSGVRLIVLPKWLTTPQPLHPGWVRKVSIWNASGVASVVASLVKKAKIRQDAKIHRTGLAGMYPRFRAVAPGHPVPLETAQTISGENLEPDIVDDNGNAVLARIEGTQTYVLSDPDLLDNLGLGDKNTALFAYQLIQMLRLNGQPVSFDVTLNGFGQSPSLLRIMFSPPFLGATLCAILAAAFIAFHAFRRFGGEARPDRVFAFGKRALADNTAAVIRMMRREPRMAQPYARAMLNVVATHIGLSREKAANTAWVRSLETRGRMTEHFDELNAEAAQVRDTHALIKVAARLYRWRRGVLNEHR